MDKKRGEIKIEIRNAMLHLEMMHKLTRNFEIEKGA